MNRIWVMLILIVSMGYLTGCDKIHKELENRHLSNGHKTEVIKDVQDTMQKKVARVKDAVQTKNANASTEPSTSSRKELVIRIDWPANKKVQIRLIKSKESEDSKRQQPEQKPAESIPNTAELIKSPKPNSEPTPEIKAEPNSEPIPDSKAETKIEQKIETKSVPKSELKSEPESKPKSEIKSESNLSHKKTESKSLGALSRLLIPRPVKPNQAPIQVPIGVAPVVETPRVTRPPVAPPISENASPWIIPNAHYPLRLE